MKLVAMAKQLIQLLTNWTKSVINAEPVQDITKKCGHVRDRRINRAIDESIDEINN